MKHTLNRIAQFLKANEYKFITISPNSHNRILARTEVSDALAQAHLLEEQGELIKSRIRASTYDNLLFFHSGFPTDDKDSVFFGPDSYRFLNFLEHQNLDGHVVFDIGCGSGVGGLALSHFLKNQGKKDIQVILSDVNSKALEFSAANSEINQVVNVQTVQGHFLNQAPNSCDIFISNPPFIIDEKARVYRNGGGEYGTDISYEIVKSFLGFDRQSKSLYMYTGTPIVKGEDAFLKALLPWMKDAQISSWTYREIDPDIFGEQLDSEAYQNFERIAAVGLVINCR